MKNRISSAVKKGSICIVSVICVLFLSMAVADDFFDKSGTLGDCSWSLKNVRLYTINDNPALGYGSLIILGNGKIGDCRDYDYSQPWYGYFDGREYPNAVIYVLVNGGITDIGDNVFRCMPITSVPDTVVSVGKNSFMHSDISNIDFSNIKSIGEGAFYGCKNLTNVCLSDQIERIENYTFSFCSNLESITIPYGVTSIGDSAFAYCKSLKSIVIPDSVTSIGKNAFEGCSSLESITIPENAVIKSGAFKGCTGCVDYIDENGLLIIRDVVYDCVKSADYRSVTIPEGIRSIGWQAFYGDDKLTDIIFPSSLRIIEEDAFGECKNLSTVTFLDTIESIGDYAFYYCSNLETITLTNITNTSDMYRRIFLLCDKLHCISIRDCSASSAIDWFVSQGFGQYLKLNHKTRYIDQVTPSCTSNGMNAYWSCETCGKQFSDEEGVNEITEPIEVPALGHTFEHHEAKAATCTDFGWDEYDTCSVCGYSTYVEKTALGHDLVHHEAKTPTCTEVGWDEYDACTRGDYTTYVEKAALGHDLVHHEAKAPSCTEIGWDEYDTCVHCDYNSCVVIPVQGHMLKAHAQIDATCTTEGTEAYWECSICGKLFSEGEGENEIEAPVTIEAQGHNWGIPVYSWSEDNSTVSATRVCIRNNEHMETETVAATNAVTKQPSCTEKGQTTYTSTDFENEAFSVQTKTVSNINMLEHIAVMDEAVQATCTHTGLTEGSHCEVCGSVLIAQTITPKTAHTYVVDQAVAATCIETGLTVGVHCSVCGEVVVAQEVVPALGHALILHEAKAATCTEVGWDEYETCSRCDYTNYVEKAMLGHTPVIDPAVSSTQTQTGLTEGSHCAVCGQILVAQEVIPVNPESSIVASGSCGYGYNVLWSLDSDGRLEISGSGPMRGYEIDIINNRTGAPWGQYAEHIRSVIINSGVTKIGSNAFYKCENITNIVLNESVTTIGEHAFSYCSSLIDISLPNSLVSMKSAFTGCKNLKSIYIPDNVSEIAGSNFTECNNLQNIIVSQNNPYYSSYDGALFSDSLDELILCPMGKTGQYTIPDGVKRIGGFSACNKLTKIVIPDSVEIINSYAFMSCSNLMNIDIPYGISNIGFMAFSSCESLMKVSIPNSVQSIDAFAFANCHSLSAVELPTSLCELGTGAFEGCTSLTSITIPEGIQSIPDYAFSDCSNLHCVKLPNSLLTLGSAFAQCRSLTELTIPNNVTTLKNNAFINCVYLEKLFIPESVVSIESLLFGDSEYNNMPYLTIYCYEYSYADYWAQEKGIPVAYIDQIDVDSIRSIELQDISMLPVGCNYALTYSVFPAHDTPTIVWTSNDPSIISVEDGIVTANTTGTATITATVASVSKSVTIKSYIPAESYEISATEIWLVSKEAIQLNITDILPTNSEPVVFWSSSDTTYATVDSTGLVSTKKPTDEGIIITADSENEIHRECLIHICYPVTAVDFEEYEATIIPNSDYRVLANVTMRSQNCINHLVTFTSSNPEIATVDANGVVHGITVGTTTITATAASGVKASMTIHVRTPNKMLIPSGTTEIEEEAFMGTACEIVIIPDGCAAIGERAFAGCINLVYVKIPSTITSYPENAFEGCNDNLVIDWIEH